MNLHIRAAGLMLAASVLAGCATKPQLPVALNAESLGAQAGKVGVAMTPLPKADTSFPGASCLLCIAAASMANTTLTGHARTLPAEDLPRLKDMIGEALRRKGSEVRVLEQEVRVDDLPDASSKGPNIALKDFGALRARHGIDKLVVVSIDALGFERTYAAYFPTSDPKALLRGVAYMVDLKSNTYDWYLPLNVLRSADGAWDEPNKFPGLTNAYFQAIESGKDEVLKPFKP